MLVMRVDGQFTDNTLETLERDPLLSGDSDGVRFLFDAAFPFSYAAGAPANGKAVNDVAEHGNGSFVLATGETVAFNGNGFDLSAMTAITGKSDAHVIGPSAVWSDIYANQQFMVCVYMRLPAEADWNVETSLLPFFASSTGAASGYTNVADPLTMFFHNTSKSLRSRRQTAIGSQVELNVTPTGNYGQIVQVAYWRSASGVGLRVKGAAATQLTTAAVGADNTADFSACQPRFGSVYPFTNYGLASHQTGRKYRLYRGFIENLNRSSRDPVTVLDEDYSRTVARGVFS